MTAWAFYAIGKPASQGNKHHVGHGILVENASLKPWRDTVTAAAFGAGQCLTGPLAVRMVFTVPRPKSARKTDRVPSTRPDVGKLARAAEDAITAAGLWHDDSQVADYHRLAKVWTTFDHEALPVPGVIVACAEIYTEGDVSRDLDAAMRVSLSEAWRIAEEVAP